VRRQTPHRGADTFDEDRVRGSLVAKQGSREVERTLPAMLEIAQRLGEELALDPHEVLEPVPRDRTATSPAIRIEPVHQPRSGPCSDDQGARSRHDLSSCGNEGQARSHRAAKRATRKSARATSRRHGALRA